MNALLLPVTHVNSAWHLDTRRGEKRGGGVGVERDGVEVELVAQISRELRV